MATPERQQRWRDKNKEKLRAYAKAYGKSKVAKKNAYRLELLQLLGGKCVDCGIPDHRVLDFDHIDPADKSYGMNYALLLSPAKAHAEALKCELRCANCHRIKTLWR